ncbi:MAG: hypothetical protein AB1646_25760 [Thermodesulfobacteriota bacterium]
MTDPTDTMQRLQDHLEGRPQGEMARIAALSGFNRSTVSRFARGTYQGNLEHVSEVLARVLGSLEAAERLASGSGRMQWVIVTPDGLKLAKRPQTRDGLLARYPDARVVTVVLGERPEDAVFVPTEDPPQRHRGHREEIEKTKN